MQRERVLSVTNDSKVSEFPNIIHASHFGQKLFFSMHFSKDSCSLIKVRSTRAVDIYAHTVKLMGDNTLYHGARKSYSGSHAINLGISILARLAFMHLILILVSTVHRLLYKVVVVQLVKKFFVY
jgi:hypothetical protein